MGFKAKRIITLPKWVAANLDPLPGPGPFGNLLSAPITFLRPIYVPKPGTVIAFNFFDQGVGNYDFGIYTPSPDFRRIFSTGIVASTGTNAFRQIAIAAAQQPTLPAGAYLLASAYSATGIGRRTVNVWPMFSQAVGPPLPAQLAPAVDDSSNVSLDINFVFA